VISKGVTRNITVSVDAETYRNARIKAAESNTSVSALVRSFLVRLSQGQVVDREYEKLRRLQEETLAAIRARGAGLDSADNLNRNELHEKDALR